MFSTANGVTQLLSYIFLVAAITYVLNFHWNRRKLYMFSWQTKGPFAWPLIGNALIFLRLSPGDVPNKLEEMHKKYKGSYRGWFGPKLAYIVQSPEELAVIMNSPKCLEKDDVYKIFSVLLQNGLVTAPVSIWKSNRKAILPIFNQKVLNSHIPIFEEQTKILVGKLDKYAGKGEFDVLSPLNFCLLDIIMEYSIGYRVRNQEKESDFYVHYKRLKLVAFKAVFNIIYSAVAYIVCKCVGVDGFLTHIVEMRKFVQQAVDNAEKVEDVNMDDVTMRRRSLLEYISECKVDGEKFSNKQIVDEMMNFILAASDTSAYSAGFIALALGTYPEIQDKVIKEVDAIFGDSDRPITIDDINELKYLERVIKETMRFFPVSLLMARKTTGDVELKNGVTIPEGVTVAINMYGLHRDPDVWPDPMKFDPDRFLPEEVAKRSQYAFIPFSAGPRNCIGSQYGYKVLKVLFANILRTYTFKSPYKKIEDIAVTIPGITVEPVNGFKVQLEYRKPIM